MSENSEEKLEEEEEKGKAEKRKKVSSSLYKIENNRIERLRPTCERCGLGYFMADHGDRYACGHCGFTRYKPVEDKK